MPWLFGFMISIHIEIFKSSWCSETIWIISIDIFYCFVDPKGNCVPYCSFLSCLKKTRKTICILSFTFSKLELKGKNQSGNLCRKKYFLWLKERCNYSSVLGRPERYVAVLEDRSSRYGWSRSISTIDNLWFTIDNHHRDRQTFMIDDRFNFTIDDRYVQKPTS